MLARIFVTMGGAAIAVAGTAVVSLPAGAFAQESHEAAPAPETVTLTVEQLRDRLAGGNVRLIDVRTAEEVAEGVIPGAEHIALDQFDPATLDLTDGREVILYCRSGRRSQIAADRLAAHTNEPAHHLGGGIIAWIAADGAIEARVDP